MTRITAPPKLTYTRPPVNIRLGRLKHRVDRGFSFNRPATPADLGKIRPARPDRFDRQNYRLEQGNLVSTVNPRFILADSAKVNESSVVAMLALGKILVLRQKNGPSVYLFGDHTWALWSWCEAAARREISQQGNTLVHVDMHEDVLGEPARLLDEPLTLANVDRVMAQEVLTEPDIPNSGIARFIVPAVKYGLITKVYWEYSKNPTADDLYEKSELLKASLERMEQDRRLGDPFGLLSSPAYVAHYSAMPPLLADKSEYTNAQIANAPGVFAGYRSDVFQRHFARQPGSGLILDIDLDVDDKPGEIRRLTEENLVHRPGCITVAISPDYGTDNHLEKVMTLLDLFRARWPR